jgi:hypothetical protein
LVSSIHEKLRGVAVLRISLPDELAIALIDDGIAIRPYRTRAGTPDAITLMIDGVNTAASLVTLAATAAACRRLA